MTSQEEQMLNSLVERVNATQLSEKDPDAAALLARGLSGNPDALYILAQSVLVQNIALEQAHAQLAQARQPAKTTSFLGSLLGHRDSAPPPPPQGYQQVYNPQTQPEYYPPPPPYQAGYAPPQSGPYYGAPPMSGMGGMMGGPGGFGGQPSFLRSAAQTAAGVAAGALAFEGVEALLHGGFGHPGMGMGMGGWGMPGVGFGMGPGMGMGGMGYERPIEENVVNNYYDSPGGSGGEHYEHGGEQHFHESAGDGGGTLSDASWSEGSGGSSDSGTSFDDSGSGFDDSGSGSGDGGSGGDGGGF